MHTIINLLYNHIGYSHIYPLYYTSKSMQRYMRINELHHDFIKKKSLYKWSIYIQQNKIRKRRNSWNKTLHHDDEKLIPPIDMLV